MGIAYMIFRITDVNHTSSFWDWLFRWRCINWLRSYCILYHITREPIATFWYRGEIVPVLEYQHDTETDLTYYDWKYGKKRKKSAYNLIELRACWVKTFLEVVPEPGVDLAHIIKVWGDKGGYIMWTFHAVVDARYGKYTNVLTLPLINDIMNRK